MHRAVSGIFAIYACTRKNFRLQVQSVMVTPKTEPLLVAALGKLKLVLMPRISGHRKRNERSTEAKASCFRMLFVSVCVCVCVCARARMRSVCVCWRLRAGAPQHLLLQVRMPLHVQASFSVLVCVCVLSLRVTLRRRL